jgi:homocysteine S-methyltransferase
MAYPGIKRRLDAGGIVILDGATGTELQRRGATMNPTAWCAPATLEHGETLAAIHADYIAAGADVITANTFAAARHLLARSGHGDRVEEIVRRAVGIALAARETAKAGREIAVAGSLSHMMPMVEGESVVDRARLPSDAEIGDSLHELAGLLKAAGCDLIILEMMYHPGRARLAIAAAMATGLPVWFGFSARRGKDGAVLAFHHFEDLPIAAITDLIPASGVDAAGPMHTAVELIDDALVATRRAFRGPLMAYPDSGHFEAPIWNFASVIAPEAFGRACRRWIADGARVLGGCCGLGVEHVRAAARARDALAA